jgi:hypothetical protein
VPVTQVQAGLTSAQLAAGAVAPAAVSSTGSILGADGAPVSGGLVSTTSYASAAALESAYPAASNGGKQGIVGTAIYYSNGTAWTATGGASSWSGLSDKATANLPVENAPLAAALAAASSGTNQSAFQNLNGFAKPAVVAPFLARAQSGQVRVLLMGTSIASFDASAPRVVAERLVAKYGLAGTVQHLGAYGGDYNAQGGYAKQKFGGSSFNRLVLQSTNSALTLKGYGDRVILVYSKDGGSTTTAAVNGGTAQTVDCSGAQAYNQELVFDLSAPGSAALVIQPPTSGQIFLERVEFIDRTKTGVIVENATLGGSALANHSTILADGGTGNVAGIPIVGNNGIDAMVSRPGLTAADAIICEHFTNDGNAATFQTLINYMVTATALKMLPLVLMSEQPAVSFVQGTGGSLDASKTTMLQTLRNAASASHVMFLDWTALVDYSDKAAYTAKYYTSPDFTHPNSLGMALPVAPLCGIFRVEPIATTVAGTQTEAAAVIAAGSNLSSATVDQWGLLVYPPGSARLAKVGVRTGPVTSIGSAYQLAGNRYQNIFLAPHAYDMTLSSGSTLTGALVAASGTADAFGPYLAGGQLKSWPGPTVGDLTQAYFTLVVLARKVLSGTVSWVVADTSVSNQDPKVIINGASTGSSFVLDSRTTDRRPVFLTMTVQADPARPQGLPTFTVPSAYRVYGAWVVNGSLPLIPTGIAEASPQGGPPLMLSSEFTLDQVKPGFDYIENVGGSLIQKRATSGYVIRPLESNKVTPIYAMVDRSGDNIKLMAPTGHSGGAAAYSADIGGGQLTGYTNTASYQTSFTTFPWSTLYTVMFRSPKSMSTFIGAALYLYNGGNNTTVGLQAGGTWTASKQTNFGYAPGPETIALSFTLPAQADFSLGTSPVLRLEVSGPLTYATAAKGGSACI